MTEPLVDVTGARKRRAQAKRLRTLKRVALAVGVLALIGALAWVVWGSPWLLARQVEVRGTSLLSVQQVTDAAQVPLDTPLAAVDTAGVEQRITTALPAAASARAGRSWPGTVVIDVTERTPALSIPLGREYLWVAGDGVIFHRTATPPEGVLLVNGSVTDEETITALAKVAAALPPAVRERAEGIIAASRDSVVINLTDGRRVVWGSSDDSELKARVVVPLLKVKAREYDVSAPTHPITR
ncbi:FtsQ-type POTRA domain-containing protein [Propioniciclava coleopterorum]|uniref:FtsQ-type POTRA domain-containing protein n=1 Tax=Propioniciclava coleopterorum TaxID=2714937 RepID=A0A6G7Y8J1_9ACTN|nr:FtsQ-type POTRA domain-containing protein [Propioniciclava coleopterorum]QIK72968.1 FtsQ-type POTRA domain-containing protein [Propioniciclava coleopterorum]